MPFVGVGSVPTFADLRSLSLLGGALACLTGGCASTRSDETRVAAAEAVSLGNPAGGVPDSLIVSFDRPPRLINREQVRRALAGHYPQTLSSAGIGGTVDVLLHIGVDGRVIETGVAKSSGSAQLDRAAQRVGLAMRFRPAEAEGTPPPL